MPLPSDYVGTVLTHPLQVVQKHKGRLMTTGRSDLRLNPSYLVKQVWTNPATIDADGYSASHVGADAAGTTSMTLGGALCTGGVGNTADGYPRNVVITVTHSSAVVAMSGVITGTNIYGNVITEAWSVTAGTTSKTFTGKKAFYTVTSITEVVAADASANTIVAGNGKVLGLNFLNTLIVPIGETEDGATPTAGVLVAGVIGSATVDNLGTYTPNSTLNGALDFRIYYFCDDPTTMEGVV